MAVYEGKNSRARRHLDVVVPTQDTPPGEPSVGQLYWSKSEDALYYFNGESWDNVAGSGGARGPDGPQGEPGEPGKDGGPGKDGVDGKDGDPGKDGVDGKDGAQGPQGEYAAQIMDADIANNAEISPEKLNLSGSKLVVGSETSLLIIGGIIQTTSWAPEAGEGFGWSPDTVGSGKITFFPTVFDGVPSVTLTAMTSDRLLTVTSSTLTGSTCNVTALNGAGAEADTRFSFIALGKRL